MDEETKVGNRNNAGDRMRLQQIHDFAVENGAMCADKPEVETMPMMSLSPDDALVNYGDEVKATRMDDGSLKIGGYLVRFGGSDLTGEHFEADTDFDMEPAAKTTVYFHHGLDPVVGKRKLGKADLTTDSIGIWFEHILAERDEYEKMIAELAVSGKLGLSSGSVSHLVERDGSKITRWPIAEASLTHTPAEPRNSVVPLKSLLSVEPEDGGGPSADTVTVIQSVMQEEKPTMELTKEELAEMLDSAATKAVEKAAPAVVKAGVSVTVDEGDRPFKSLAEQCSAVKAYTVSMGRTIDQRLNRLGVKALGASEGINSEGGFLLDPTLTSEILKPVHETGPFSSVVRKLPVSSNSNYGWINGVDETSRATGSRWGGIRGYRLAEAATKTASKPAFRRINWELKKYAVAMYATDELLNDASQFSAIVQMGASEELSFMVNEDIFSGLGVAGPLGFMASPALISVAKEVGQGAATIVNENLMKMWARVHPRSKGAGKWYYNTDCSPQLHALTLNAGLSSLDPRFVSYGSDGSLAIFGRPAVETEFNETLGTVGDLVFFDGSEYLMWDKAAEAASSIHVQFLTDETTFRFVYRVDGQPSIASALTPFKGTNTISPFVALATRA